MQSAKMVSESAMIGSRIGGNTMRSSNDEMDETRSDQVSNLITGGLVTMRGLAASNHETRLTIIDHNPPI